MKFLMLVIFIIAIAMSHTSFASIEKAQLMITHGLTEDAKRVIIDAIFDSKKSNEKAYGYYLLGKIAFAEKNMSVAIETWGILISQYPNTEFAKSAADLLPQMSDVLSKESRHNVQNLKARLYLRNADFWSEDRDRFWGIDTSWLLPVEAAIKWYDLTITEFPKSEAARQAYIAKVRTLLGWKRSGQYGQAYGLRGSLKKATYMSSLLQTFEDFQKDFPDEISSHQAIRYQIAQVYWRDKDWGRTRKWLKLIVSVDKSDESFYRDLAERRLKVVEY